MDNNTEKTLNKKKVVIAIIAVLIFITAAAIITKICVDNAIIEEQMKNAKNAITIKNDVAIYSSKNMKRKKETFPIGTDTYLLEDTTNKNNEEICKVKVGKRVGYIYKSDVDYFKEATEKKELMLDVSQFNMSNNFSSIGEFKALIINHNIKYVYIRAGGRGYGKAGKLYLDDNSKEFADACEYLGIPFGFYFLEEAITSEEIDEEIQFIEDFIEKNQYKNNKLPIALDIEKHVETGRADEIWDTRYELINEMIDKMNKKGMDVIVYSNAGVASEYLTDVKTELWLAYYPRITQTPDNWYSDTETEGASNKQLISKMVGWQFTETGIPDTIDEKVDVSIVYSNYFKTGSMDDIIFDTSESSSMNIMDTIKLLSKRKMIKDWFFSFINYTEK